MKNIKNTSVFTLINIYFFKVEKRIKHLFLPFTLYLGLFSICISCSTYNANSERSVDNVKLQNSKVNAEGFGGVNAEGFGGIIKPIVNVIEVPNEFNIPKHSIMYLKGSNFEKAIIVKLSGINCTVSNIEFSSDSFSCILEDSIKSITSVMTANFTGSFSSSTPLIKIYSKCWVRGPLSTILRAKTLEEEKNAFYCDPEIAPYTEEPLLIQETDSDGDSVYDHEDNCPELYNPDQNDEDGNGGGGCLRT